MMCLQNTATWTVAVATRAARCADIVVVAVAVVVARDAAAARVAVQPAAAIKPRLYARQ